MNEIVSDWNGEDTGHSDAIGNFLGAIALVYADNWS